MGLSAFSPTSCSHTGFKSVGDLTKIYDQDNSNSCLTRVGGSNTGTLTLSGLKAVTKIGSVTYDTMPSYAVVTCVYAAVIANTVALKHPTCTISLKSGSTVLASNSSSSWGAAANPEQLNAGKSYAASEGKTIDWVKGLTVTFAEKGNYSLSTSNSDQYVWEVAVFAEWELPTYTVTLDANGGTVSPTSKSYTAGDTYGTLPTPSRPGCKFNYWMKSDGTRIYSSTAIWDNHTLYANWTIPTYTVTITANPTNGGTIAGSGTYDGGTTVAAIATPAEGYKFVGWADQEGNITVTDNPYTFTAIADTTFSAVFQKKTYTATFKNYDGTVLQTVTVEHGSTPNYTGSTPTKAQDAEYSYSFSGWSPSLGAITANTTYTAQYTATKRSYTITAVASPLEAGVVTGGGSGLYGTTKTLTATANSGYKFVKWSDGITTTSRSITITGNATYTAVFEKIKTSNVYCGIKKVSAYCGTKKVSVYCGTQKLI